MSQFIAHVRLESGARSEEIVGRMTEDARVARAHVVRRPDGAPSEDAVLLHVVLESPTLSEAVVVAAVHLHGHDVTSLGVRELPGSAVAWADAAEETVDLHQAAGLLGLRTGVVEAMVDTGMLEIVSCTGGVPRVSPAAVARMRDAGD